jgi:hypothetical protein
MRRPLSQVAASQAEMIRRRASKAPAIPASAMQTALETHLRAATAWLAGRSTIAVHWLDFPKLIAQPREHAAGVAEFLGGDLDVERMAERVDANLFRNR